MSTQFTIDDSSSFQCFCGFKHCCCRCFRFQFGKQISILHELKLQEQREKLKQKERYSTVERKRNRKSIFDKKYCQMSELQKQEKKTMSIGSLQNIPTQVLFETKKTFKKISNHRPIFARQDINNNTTIIFDPSVLKKHESYLQNISFQQNPMNIEGFISSNESKLILELFLQSDLFESVPQKNNNVQIQDLTLPSIMSKFGTMISSSILLFGATQQILKQQQNYLSSCFQEGIKLNSDLTMAISQIDKYLHSRSQLLDNLNIDNFFAGEWYPNWERLSILLPGGSFRPKMRNLKQCSIMLSQNANILKKSKQQIQKSDLTMPIYIKSRSILVQVSLSTKEVCEDLYNIVRSNRMDPVYETGYRLYIYNFLYFGQSSSHLSKAELKELMTQRQQYLTKLQYRKQINDKLWSTGILQKLVTKISKDMQIIKNKYFSKTK